MLMLCFCCGPWHIAVIKLLLSCNTVKTLVASQVFSAVEWTDRALGYNSLHVNEYSREC